ncbi:MAG: aminoglycoside phosphotransferase family protein [Pseudomonadota bacterium]
MIPLKDGRNNRVYQIISKEKQYIVKQYFSCFDDKRDRLGAEISVLLFARQNGLKQIPEPIDWDKKNNLALFSCLKGRKLKGEQINVHHIEQALNFIVQLNKFQQKKTKGEIDLPMASEACLSFKDHIENTEHRIELLSQAPAKNQLERSVKQFIEKDLIPVFQTIEQEIRSGIGKQQSFNQIISDREKIISPSDFGFHNALINDDDNLLYFFDFEYAGWDDVVKLICDFFCQPDIPVPTDHLAWFTRFLVHGLDQEDIKETIIHRSGLLMPLYRVKWCCIMLNVFLIKDFKRRQFAWCNTGLQEKQFKKTISYFQRHLLGI